MKMCDQQNNVRLIWQLLSQFVSWEFCRYMCEENENSKSEIDVLAFLRNMIVQRTEKSVSDITKHEIVAKFIMETKAIQSISRMPCITTLSESVKRICPELESAVSKLVHHLETFLRILDSTDEHREQIIEVRINDAINDFSREAERLLPQPDLIQVVESWNIHHGHIPQKPVKKVIYNAMLFEKVLECLHFESITASEAKLIAVALYEDKVFERILLSAEAEPTETEADSEQFSLSIQSSQPNEHVYSQEFGKNVGMQKNCRSTSADSLSAPALQVPDEFSEVPNEIYEEPPALAPVEASVVSSPVQISPSNHLIHRDISETSRNLQLQNNATDSNIQFAQSPCNESSPDKLNSILHDEINENFEINYQRNQNLSDSDTSDCDKNPQFRFLTPTFYKKGAPSQSQVVWLSDEGSNDSSILTSAPNSQQNDPNWYSKERSRAPSQNVSMRNTRQRTQTQALCPSDSDSDDDLHNTSARSNSNISTRANTLFSASRGTMRNLRQRTQKQPLCPSGSDSDDVSHRTSARDNSNISIGANAFVSPSRGTMKNLRQRTQKQPLCSSDSDSDDVSNRTSARNNSNISTGANAFLSPCRTKSKKTVRVLESDSSESLHNSLVENEGNLLHRLQQLPSTSVNLTDAEIEISSKRRRMTKTVKLYTPNRSIDDFTQIRRPVSVVPSEVPMHRGTNTKHVRINHTESTASSNRHKCKHCNKSYKTAVGLRRHVFLKHTKPPDDSDS